VKKNISVPRTTKTETVITKAVRKLAGKTTVKKNIKR